MKNTNLRSKTLCQVKLDDVAHEKDNTTISLVLLKETHNNQSLFYVVEKD